MDLNWASDANSEDKDMVKSLNSQGRNKVNIGLNHSIQTASDKSYNF